MRQLYAYDANESTRRLVEDGITKGLTNTHTARGFSGSVSRVHSKTMHSVFFIMSWKLPYINTLHYFLLHWFEIHLTYYQEIHSALKLSRTALLGMPPRLASSRFARLLVGNNI